jgi:hypothetical protein
VTVNQREKTRRAHFHFLGKPITRGFAESQSDLEDDHRFIASFARAACGLGFDAIVPTLTIRIA